MEYSAEGLPNQVFLILLGVGTKHVQKGHLSAFLFRGHALADLETWPSREKGEEHFLRNRHVTSRDMSQTGRYTHIHIYIYIVYYIQYIHYTM